MGKEEKKSVIFLSLFFKLTREDKIIFDVDLAHIIAEHTAWNSFFLYLTKQVDIRIAFIYSSSIKVEEEKCVK